MDKSHLAPRSSLGVASGAPAPSPAPGPGSKPQPSRQFSFDRVSHRPQSFVDMNPPGPGYAGRQPRKLVLCFDGTGNKFRGDDSDSNILKIFRMLDRTASDQYHYYQPGIGTYVVSNNLSAHTSMRARFKSWMTKAKDSAIGSSFDQHVVGGYRFLMRFYSPGDEIYIFGFSRGAYIARFLAEMLDYVGLLSHGNEEMVAFAWKAFAQWQCRRGKLREESRKKTEELYEFLKGFRETFSRPVRRIRFLGLFDTVNSVPRFETAWMERAVSKFPYTARTSAKVIRHAVSIDERRAKFRQDLIYQSKHESMERKKAAAEAKAKEHGGLHQARHMIHELHEKYRVHHTHHRLQQTPVFVDPKPEVEGQGQGHGEKTNGKSAGAPQPAQDRGRRQSRQAAAAHPPPRASLDHAERYRAHHSRSKSRATHRTRDSSVAAAVAARRLSGAGHHAGHEHPDRLEVPGGDNDDDDEDRDLAHMPEASDVDDGFSSSDEDDQDIDEVWFSGGHGDVGGGWDIEPGGKSASHVPLAWMVREAIRAGLSFDMTKVVNMGCASAAECGMHVHDDENDIDGKASEQQQPPPPVPNIRVNSGSQPNTPVVGPPTGEDKDDRGCSNGHEHSHSHSHNHDLSTLKNDVHAAFHDLICHAHTARIHDSLSFDCGMSAGSVLSWRIMEYMPFRRMDLQGDGSWKPIRWPLPRGEVRDIPDDARVHGSVIRRMRADERYRPGNLIVGGGGRGVRVAPPERGIGNWICVAGEGDPIDEIWVKQKEDGSERNGHGRGNGSGHRHGNGHGHSNGNRNGVEVNGKNQ
ncbi:hypothetical protein MAPG_09404 [Magnaporthiopsis poae ATCC 64411]|uniref:T6SS Phospholipase effector Tle1-like catalytic domain-containing protein n=1 Tax=Magnaporthiopsis poae (strain ATCC 64411 / 73-15) TaxID=644358 RepID=A0A0C4E9V4_MAGP6|nr:hypothetical protein MAPG_09404 [Magnaporthiopsis poae ATCC 64411]